MLSFSIVQFRFATWMDWLVMGVGATAAVVHGITVPLLMVIFGETTDTFSNEYLSRKVARSLPNTSSGGDVNCTEIYLACSAQPECQFVVDDSLCTTEDKLIDNINVLVIYFCSLGMVLFICGTLHISLFQFACERQLQVIRKRFFKSILRQEIGWFDVTSTDELNSRMSQ